MPKDKLPDNSWAKYSGMGFQMGATIGIGMYAGIKLDEYFPVGKFPLFTIIFALASVFGSIYLVIKDFLKK